MKYWSLIPSALMSVRCSLFVKLLRYNERSNIMAHVRKHISTPILLSILYTNSLVLCSRV